MKKLAFLFLFFLSAIVEAAPSEKKERAIINFMTFVEANLAMIELPEDWGMPALSVKLPPHVLFIAVGKGQHPFPPSVNLTYQPFEGTLKQYLKNVKAINEARKDEWKDLGNFRTESGIANLSQVNAKTAWGETKTMHVILLKDGIIYILTASATKEEFPNFYKDFFNTMRSIRIVKNALDLVKPAQRKAQLQTTIQNLQTQYQSLLAQQQQTTPENSKDQVFQGEEFKSKYWNIFKLLIDQQFTDMGPSWQNFILEKTKNDLLDAPL